MDYIDHIILKQLMKILGLVVIGVAIGYFWCYQALAYQTCLETTQPAGWVASASIKTAMQKMGPRYDYKMVGEILYVDTGKGWRRLRYGRNTN